MNILLNSNKPRGIISGVQFGKQPFGSYFFIYFFLFSSIVLLIIGLFIQIPIIIHGFFLIIIIICSIKIIGFKKIANNRKKIFMYGDIIKISVTQHKQVFSLFKSRPDYIIIFEYNINDTLVHHSCQVSQKNIVDNFPIGSLHTGLILENTILTALDLGGENFLQQ